MKLMLNHVNEDGLICTNDKEEKKIVSYEQLTNSNSSEVGYYGWKLVTCILRKVSMWVDHSSLS